MNPIKIILGMGIFALIMFSGWLFFWPLVECWYALSWEPLLSSQWKMISCIGGALVFFPSAYGGFRFIV